MDVWDTLIRQAKEAEEHAEQTLRYAKIARENTEATAKFWREKHGTNRKSNKNES